MRRHSQLPVIAAMAISAAIGGCRHPTRICCPEPQPPVFLQQDSPTACLLNLQRAYIRRDLSAYSALFASDFTFVFSPADVDFQLPFYQPPSWPLVDEEASADHMFHSSLVDKIELSFDLGPAVRSDSLLAGTWSIRINDVNLLVYILQDGAPSFYRVTNGTEIFYFREYPAERTSDGLPLWRIWRWEDEPFLPPGGASARTRQANTHWGIIKRLWS